MPPVLVCERDSRLHILSLEGDKPGQGAWGRKERGVGGEGTGPSSPRLCAPGRSLLGPPPDSLGTKPSCPNPFVSGSRSCYSASQPGKHRSRPATCAQEGCPAGTWGLELFIGVQFLCEQDSLRPENVLGVSPGMGAAPLLPGSWPLGAMPYGYTFSQISLFGKPEWKLLSVLPTWTWTWSLRPSV